VDSLIHPERTANIWEVKFSRDGGRLFASGYPSGIVQIWDVASKNQVRRFDTPSGLRGTAQYALLDPDWKNLYVPVEKRSVKNLEQDGKRRYRIDYTGRIRVWDVASGQEKEPLVGSKDSAPVYAELAPGGRFLMYVQRASYDADKRLKDVTCVYDLESGKHWKLCDGFAVPACLPDGKSVLVAVNDYNTKKSTVKLLDLATAKELASLDSPEKDHYLSLGPVAPDGSIAAVYLGGKKGSPIEVSFRDPRTLEERGKLTGKSDPDRNGYGVGKFTPDGKLFVLLDGTGRALVWDVAEKTLKRTIPYGNNRQAWQMAVSPDGKKIAIGWMPKAEPSLEEARDPDPQDLPQPRVSLVNLDGAIPPRTLIAPHGYVGSIAFSPDGKFLAMGTSGAIRLFDLTK
jgi:WD40 repeat protein